MDRLETFIGKHDKGLMQKAHRRVTQAVVSLLLERYGILSSTPQDTPLHLRSLRELAYYNARRLRQGQQPIEPNEWINFLNQMGGKIPRRWQTRLWAVYELQNQADI